jgi:hypothetical protein
MQFTITNATDRLKRTPALLHHLLHDTEQEWMYSREGENTWCTYDVLGHLVHAENNGWIQRAEVILSDNKDKTFKPFDRFAHMNAPEIKTVMQLLSEFQYLREQNIHRLHEMNLTKTDLDKNGIHPSLGSVTLRQLLSTWVTHDLAHLSQINRIMARQFKEEVGPWIANLRILH